nr:MAG TPA: hypothetical protein [Caudoviricetes sp.]
MHLFDSKNVQGIGSVELLFSFVLSGAIIIYVCPVCNSVCPFLFFLYNLPKYRELFVCFTQDLRSYAMKQG